VRRRTDCRRYGEMPLAETATGCLDRITWQGLRRITCGTRCLQECPSPKVKENCWMRGRRATTRCTWTLRPPQQDCGLQVVGTVPVFGSRHSGPNAVVTFAPLIIAIGPATCSPLKGVVPVIHNPRIYRIVKPEAHVEVLTGAQFRSSLEAKDLIHQDRMDSNCRISCGVSLNVGLVPPPGRSFPGRNCFGPISEKWAVLDREQIECQFRLNVAQRDRQRIVQFALDYANGCAWRSRGRKTVQEGRFGDQLKS
jgi:hypothetical protein